jgi:malate dehydrogenase (oxaloacetate-decarboxylating)(NADP+)
MRAAVSYVNQQLGTAILLGREEQIRETAKEAGIDLDRPGIEIINARLSRRVVYADYLYARLQREGYLFRDCQRLINNDRNHFAACHGGARRCRRHGDRRDAQLFDRARRMSAASSTQAPATASSACRWRCAGAARCSLPTPPSSTCRARGTGRHRRGGRRHGPPHGLRAARGDARLFHLRPSAGERSERVREAVRILDKRRVDFEYDGEMAADVALNSEVMEQYPFCRLSGTANVLVMPAFHSASISTKMLQELGGSTVIGPLLVGLDKSIQIVSLGAKDADIVNMAAIAAYNAHDLS